jgi:hypothetical protein
VTTTWMSKSSTILWAQVHKIFWSTIPWAKAWSWRADVHFIRLWKTASKTTFHIEMQIHNLKTLGKSMTQKVPFAMWRLSKSWLHEIKVEWLWRCPSQFEKSSKVDCCSTFSSWATTILFLKILNLLQITFLKQNENKVLWPY